MVAVATTLTVGACGSDDAGSSSDELVVFAAASLTESYTELGAAFETEHPDASVVFNFAASSELVAQIGNGARADVFASADLNNMNTLVDAGDNDGEPVVFATNRSEIIVGPGNPLGVTGIESLADPEVIVVVCAPDVPCGSYAAQIFERAGVSLTPASYEENVKGVVTKVTLGEADAGIAYATDVIAAGDGASGVEIPDDVNVIAEYPIAVTAESSNGDLARAFVDFVVSPAGQDILASYGFTAP